MIHVALPPCVRSLLAVLLLAALPAAAQDIDVEKATNGLDADSPPGPALTVGDPVAWTYEVTNTGSRDLEAVSVVDDQGVIVSCPSSTLPAGESMTCTANGTAVAGQYANLGTASGTISGTATVVSDSDPSHYLGQAAPAIAIEKSTEGLDADLPPGPILPVGDPVSWTYEVTNIGPDPLDDVTVTDDQGVAVTCPATTLAAGASMTCTASGAVQPGQYANLGSVVATLPGSETTAASDPSHYFGQVLLLEKATEGDDADLPPGPLLVTGTTVSWTYVVTNPGPATVTAVAVTDDQGVVPTCPVTTLAAGESVTCTASGTVQAGPYANVGTATALLPLGGTVSASDPSHYFGALIGLEKTTNGFDADLPPGPSLTIADPVAWAYVVTNFSAETLTNVAVTDDQGVVVTCPGTDLAGGESMTCTAAGAALGGQYANLGTVTADHPTAGGLAASDPSHYFGQTEVLDFGDAPDPSFPTLFASNGARHLLGSAVFLGACVDAEAEGAASAASDGDDLAAATSTFGTCAVAGDDEDGVGFPAPLARGQTAAVDVVASAACTLSAWIDFNADGDWLDAGENLFPGGQALVAGANALAFPVPPAAVAATTHARFRCTTDGVVGSAGEASDGEVEDYAVEVTALDFGDAPDPGFPTLVAADGARHVLAGAFLGACVDGELDGQPAAAATGDDVGAGSPVVGACAGGDDEDGVAFTSPLIGGTSATVDVVTSAACTLSAWIDFEGDGDWTGPGEDLFPGGTALAPGINALSFAVPMSAVTGSALARFRCASTVLAPTGLAPDGEVEDHAVSVQAGGPLLAATKTATLDVDADGDGEADPGDTLLYTVTLANSGTVDATSVLFTDAPDPATALVVGSVTTSQGTVTEGNTGGDTSVEVDVGTLAAGGGSATITFQVTIDDPLPPGVASVTNQGQVTADGGAAVPTDDPGTPAAEDATVTVLGTPTVLEIPTLEGWALLALVLLLAWAGYRGIAGG